LPAELNSLKVVPLSRTGIREASVAELVVSPWDDQRDTRPQQSAYACLGRTTTGSRQRGMTARLLLMTALWNTPECAHCAVHRSCCRGAQRVYLLFCNRFLLTITQTNGGKENDTAAELTTAVSCRVPACALHVVRTKSGRGRENSRRRGHHARYGNHRTRCSCR